MPTLNRLTTGAVVEEVVPVSPLVLPVVVVARGEPEQAAAPRATARRLAAMSTRRQVLVRRPLGGAVREAPEGKARLRPSVRAGTADQSIHRPPASVAVRA